ncbi:ty3-gypsy retrotransposon protein [Tanacetum coccineum]
MRESTTRSGSNTVSRYHLGFNRRVAKGGIKSQSHNKIDRVMVMESRMQGNRPGIIKVLNKQVPCKSIDKNLPNVPHESPIGLKEELKAAVRIQKPRMVYKAVSIAKEFESKISHTRVLGEGRLGQHLLMWGKYGPGYLCKTGTLKVLEVEEEPDEQPINEVDHITWDANDVVEINLHAILDVLEKDLKLNTQAVAPFGVQIGNDYLISTLKRALLSTHVLRLPEFSKTFVVECDACSVGVGAILSQEEHPIAYFSKGFCPSNRFKSAYDRELLALVLTL